jgi:hypothetical protein
MMKALFIGIATTVIGGIILAVALQVFGVDDGSIQGGSDQGGSDQGESPVHTPESDSTPQPEPEPVTFDIATQLSPGQVNGQARVIIDGEQAGVLTIDQANPSDEISHTVPEPGTYSYTLEATGAVQDAYGALYQLNGHGQGSIEVEPGSDYVLSGNISGNTWQVALVEN